MARPRRTVEERVALQLRAVELRGSDWSNKAIARELGTTATTVARWFRLYDKSGIMGLETASLVSRPGSITWKHLKRIETSLKRRSQGRVLAPEQTVSQVSEMVELITGRRYSKTRISLLVRELGYRFFRTRPGGNTTGSHS